MSKITPGGRARSPDSSLFIERARILSTSAYIELEYIKNEKFAANLVDAKKHTTNWIRLYFWILGFNSALFFTMMMTSMHYFKIKYKEYTFSFISLAAVNLPVFLAIFVISGLKHISNSSQLMVSLTGALLSFYACYYFAKTMPDSATGMTLVTLFQVLGSLNQYTFQANAIKIASFYDPKCISFYYASNTLCAISSSLIAFLAVYYKATRDGFMIMFCVFLGVVVFICLVTHSIMMYSKYYQKRICEEHDPEDGKLDQIYESFLKVKGDLIILLVTVALTSITWKSVFYEIKPSFIDDSIWNNSVNIGTNGAEFFGKLQGYNFSFKPILDYFYWFPWVYNIIINGAYIWDNTDIFDTYWVLFSVLLLFLSYRNGIAITFFVSKAVLETKDPNCAMIMNYSKAAGGALGSIICLGVGYLKHLVKHSL
jgi:hypothetical protein